MRKVDGGIFIKGVTFHTKQKAYGEGQEVGNEQKSVQSNDCFGCHISNWIICA